MIDLHEYWDSHPPLQWMVQGYLKIKKEPAEEDASKLMQMPGGIVGGDAPDWLKGSQQ